MCNYKQRVWRCCGNVDHNNPWHLVSRCVFHNPPNSVCSFKNQVEPDFHIPGPCPRCKDGEERKRRDSIDKVNKWKDGHGSRRSRRYSGSYRRWFVFRELKQRKRRSGGCYGSAGRVENWWYNWNGRAFEVLDGECMWEPALLTVLEHGFLELLAPSSTFQWPGSLLMIYSMLFVLSFGCY